MRSFCMAEPVEIPGAVDVEYEFIDGAHFFTSKHPLLKGLCSASVDLKAAFEDLPIQVAGILSEDHGVQIKCQTAITYEEFLKQTISWLKVGIVRCGYGRQSLEA